MEILLLIALLFFLGMFAAIWLTVSLLGLLVTIIIAFVVGWIADQIVPGKLPYGWLGAIGAGLLGSWLGGALLGDLGPTIGGISLIPALAGAIILAFVLELIAKNRSGNREGV